MKKRKLVTVLLTASSLAACAFAFAACGEHEHTFSEGWDGKDATHHWHTATCEHTDEVSGKAEHTWGAWSTVKAATHTEAGSRKHTCTVCNYEATETVNASGHDFGAWSITEPTTEASGSATRTCKDNDGGTETVTLPALTEKDYDITNTATCTAGGKITYTFKTEKTISIIKDSPALGHLAKGESDEWTEHDASGHYYTCGRCHESIKLSHTWDETTNECKDCGHARSYSAKFLGEDDEPIVGMKAYFYTDDGVILLETDETGTAYSDVPFKEGGLEFYNVPAGYAIVSKEDLPDPAESDEYNAVFKLRKTEQSLTTRGDSHGFEYFITEDLQPGVIYSITIEAGSLDEMGMPQAREYTAKVAPCPYQSGATYTVKIIDDPKGWATFTFAGDFHYEDFSFRLGSGQTFEDTGDLMAVTASAFGELQFPYTFSFAITVGEPPEFGTEENPHPVNDVSKPLTGTVGESGTIYYQVKDDEASGEYTLTFGSGISVVVSYPEYDWDTMEKKTIVKTIASGDHTKLANAVIKISGEGDFEIAFTRYYAPGSDASVPLDGKIGEENVVEEDFGAGISSQWFKITVDAETKYTVLPNNSFTVYEADGETEVVNGDGLTAVTLAAGTYLVNANDNFTIRPYNAETDQGYSADDPIAITEAGSFKVTGSATKYYSFTYTGEGKTVFTVSSASASESGYYSASVRIGEDRYYFTNAPFNVVLNKGDVVMMSVSPYDNEVTVTIALFDYVVTDYVVTVTDGENALAGVEVSVNKTAETGEVITATTGADGKATLKLFPDEYPIVVTLTEAQEEVYELGASVSTSFTAHEVTVTLAKKVEYTFTVKNGETPVAGATITVNSLTATTNADGVATVKMAAGVYPVAVELPEGYEMYGIAKTVNTPATPTNNVYAVEISLSKRGTSENLPLAITTKEEVQSFTFAAGETLYFRVTIGSGALGVVFTQVSDGITVSDFMGPLEGNEILVDYGTTVSFSITAETAGTYSFTVEDLVPVSITTKDEAQSFTFAAGQTIHFEVTIGDAALGLIFKQIQAGLTVEADYETYTEGDELLLGYYSTTISFAVTAEEAGTYTFTVVDKLPPALELGENTVTVESYRGDDYCFTATEAGTYTFTVEGYEEGEWGPSGNYIVIGWDAVSSPYEVELEAGETIALSILSEEPGEPFKVTITFTPAE